MPESTVIIALPITDRRRSFAFYRDGLGFTTFGEPADDGVPEPLQLRLNGGTTVMLIPTGGFGWVSGGRAICPPGHSEVVLSVDADTPDGVRQLIERARAAGSEIVSEPQQQQWGFTGLFADPDGHLWQVTAASEVF